MSVLVAALHTSVASVPNDVSVRVPAAHTFVGIDAMAVVIEARDTFADATAAPREVDAVSIVEFVFAFTTDATDEVAVASALSV